MLLAGLASFVANGIYAWLFFRKTREQRMASVLS
jgi:hypothetical protein